MEPLNGKSLSVEYVPTESLLPYANNAKIHTPEQIEQIKESIRQFGFNDPIGVWRNGEIIEGHGRVIAAKELGITEVPVVHLDHLTDSERRAYALVHNKLTMNTGFDLDTLQAELERLTDIDMTKFDFDIDLGFPEEVTEKRDARYTESISVVVECANDEEAEETFNALTAEGYRCRISTL